MEGERHQAGFLDQPPKLCVLLSPLSGRGGKVSIAFVL